MSLVSERNMAPRLATTAANAVRVVNITVNQFDPDGLKHFMTVSVRAH